MLVYNSHKFITKKIKYEKYSLQCGECTQRIDFYIGDSLTLACLVPREFCVLGARVELYRDEDMSTRSIRAARHGFDAQHDIFTVTFMLSDICVSGHGGRFLYAFLFETPYGLLWGSSDGITADSRDEVIFGEMRVFARDSECVQNVSCKIGQITENQ